MAPKHQHPVTGIQILSDLRLLQSAPIELFQESALALKSGISHCQTTGDSPRWRWHQFIKQPT